MTEEEWLLCEDITQMILHLETNGHQSYRKFRLFAVGCCRSIWTGLRDQRSRTAVEVAEQYADGFVTQDTLRQAFIHGCAALEACREFSQFSEYQAIAAYLAAARNINETPEKIPVSEDAIEVASHVWSYSLDGEIAGDQKQLQPALLRDIFGNPFRPVTLDPAWLTSTAVALANGIYTERAFDRMPILADALEEAGCDNADVLLHCRGDGPHVKGCWVVDLILGKA
jgi:hypothetical protein